LLSVNISTSLDSLAILAGHMHSSIANKRVDFVSSIVDEGAEIPLQWNHDSYLGLVEPHQ
jgi:hypothetical protein